mgnify:CR=1 FL=1
MKVPLSWLQDYVDVRGSLEDLLERMTLAGLEVASVERVGDWWDRERLVVGEVLEVRPHPNADRLVLADVAYGGSEVEQVVTGAPNLFPYKGAGPVSLKVAFALEGADLYDGHKEGFVKTRLKGTKIRGVPSRAMVCSEKELGISEEHEGIMILPDDAPVGTPLADYLGDSIVDLDLTPNLARCYNMVGVAREVSALTGAPLRYPDTEWQAGGPPAADLARLEIEDPQLCARYIATVIRGVEIGPAPQWMQGRVQKAGMRPINNVVDITNYAMLLTGHPLHAFDLDRIAGGRLVVRRGVDGETMTTLDGQERTLDPDILVIADDDGPTSLAGVMGGRTTELSASTRNIVLEAAHFDPASIGRTFRRHKLASAASVRLARGVDPALPLAAARAAARPLAELGGVPLVHRTDRLTAAIPPGTTGVEFTQRYQTLLAHYGLEGQAIQAGHGNENGDVEHRPHRFERALDQQLMLGVRRDFVSREAYQDYLRDRFAQLNANRGVKKTQEMEHLRLVDLDTPESARLVPERLRRLKNGEALNFEVEHYRKDGSTFPLEVSCQVIESNGRRYYLGFHHDTVSYTHLTLPTIDSV